jgi:excisionase family DNA binding protein
MARHTPELNPTDLQILTLEDIAKLLRVTPQHVKKLYYGKQLEGAKIGTQLRFTRAAVDRWIEANMQKGPIKRPAAEAEAPSTGNRRRRRLAPLPHSA